MYTCLYTLLLLMLSYPVITGAQELQNIDSLVWQRLDSGAHPVGYRVVHLYDRTRTMPPQSASSSENSLGEISRPLQLSIWYPAADAEDGRRVERIDYFLSTLTQFNFTALEGKSRDERIAEMRHRSGPTLSDEQFQALAHEPMRARLDAKPAEGPFPLIVYGTGGGSEPWENSVLFEYLAGHGYVVVTCPAFGTYSFEMEDTARGIETKVRDMEFILARMLDETYVDTGKIGAAGWSFGGLGSIFLAMRNSYIDAVVSLDGSIAYFGGKAVVRENPFFDWRRLRVPLLHISQRGEMPDLSFLDYARYSNRTLVRTARMSHYDFAWSHAVLAAIRQQDVERLGRIAEDYAAVAGAVRAFFDRHLRSLGSEIAMPDQLATVSYFKALPAPPTPEEFIGILRRQGPEEVISVFKSARQADPEAILFTERSMIEYAQQLAARGNIGDAIRLLEMTIEAYPDSWLAQANVATLQNRNGNEDAAEQHHVRCMEIIAVREQKRLERLENTIPPLAEMAGSYGRDLQSVVIALREGELVAAGEPALRLIPLSGTKYYIDQRPGISIQFIFGVENTCEGILIKAPRGELALAKRW